MRVLIWLADRATPGGHQLQATLTAEALRRHGVDAIERSGWRIDPRGFDILHQFGTAGDLEVTRLARAAHIPIVLSPVYWSREYWAGHHVDLRARIRRTAGLTHSVLRRGARETARRLLATEMHQRVWFEQADMLLPNSEMEARAIREELELTTPMCVVPNAVDPTVFAPPSTDLGRSGVIYVGRIEPHKNQLGLIRAMKGTGIPVRIIGPVHPHHHAYMAACRALADTTVTFLPEHNQRELVAHLQTAAVHAMPSWFETTGLTSLEAALCGANVVTTDRGYARDYFGDFAHYCNPLDTGSIREAVQRALTQPAPPGLRQHVLDHFTWEHTARETMQAYEIVLSSERLSRLCGSAEPKSQVR